jgi:hypothetical protein
MTPLLDGRTLDSVSRLASAGSLWFALASVGAALLLAPAVASAQTAVNYSSSQSPSRGSGGRSAVRMWGTDAGVASPSSASLAESAITHQAFGQSAALVNSARDGFLYDSGTSIVFQSIGSQSIVSTSIYGNNNVAEIVANQTSTNNGDVNAVGSITLSGDASTTIGADTTTGSTGDTGRPGTPGTPTPGTPTPGTPTPGTPTPGTAPGPSSGGSMGTTTTGTTSDSTITVGTPPSTGGP